jgi:transcriptional regulator with XRE-family HTH domain
MKRNGYVARVLDTEKIRQLREKLGLTLEQAADAAGLSSRQAWHNIESGAVGGRRGITLDTLNAVAKALKCDAKDLLK